MWKQNPELLGWTLLHGCPIDCGCPTEQASLKTLRNRLVFLTCAAHKQTSLVQSTPACILGEHILSLPGDIILHIAQLL